MGGYVTCIKGSDFSYSTVFLLLRRGTNTRDERINLMVLLHEIGHYKKLQQFKSISAYNYLRDRNYDFNEEIADRYAIRYYKRFVKSEVLAIQQVKNEGKIADKNVGLLILDRPYTILKYLDRQEHNSEVARTRK